MNLQKILTEYILTNMNNRENKANIGKGNQNINGTVRIIHKGPELQNQMPHSSKTPPPPKPKK